jgi:MarR family transcriptional regulator, transcriptional regulator for hemolysin
MPSWKDDEAIGFLITDTARLMRAEFDNLIAAENIGVTPGEARTLAHSARAGTVRQAVLAERMGVEAMTLSTYLDRLEALGLIARDPDPTDRRAKLVRATEAAGAILARIRRVGERLREDAAESIDPEDWARFLETLKRLRTNLCDRRQDAAKARPAA